MKLGNYRDKITLQRPAFTRNGIGERVPAWEAVDGVYASVLPIRQVETVKAGGKVTETTYTIRMHYREDVLPTWSALYRGKLLQFASVVDPTNRRQELEAIAVQRG